MWYVTDCLDTIYKMNLSVYIFFYVFLQNENQISYYSIPGIVGNGLSQ